MLSSVLSLIGFGQKHTHAISAKYAEASKLNAQFELNLSNADDLLGSEQLFLQHRISTMFNSAEVEDMLLGQVEPLLRQLKSEIEVGLATSQNTQRVISNSSRFASIRKWDENLSLLHRHVAASKCQLERIEKIFGQFHRLLDNAEHDISGLEGVELTLEMFEMER